MSTVFEKLLSGEWPCAKVYEDERVFAFMGAGQVNDGNAGTQCGVIHRRFGGGHDQGVAPVVARGVGEGVAGGEGGGGGALALGFGALHHSRRLLPPCRFLELVPGRVDLTHLCLGELP